MELESFLILCRYTIEWARLMSTERKFNVKEYILVHMHIIEEFHSLNFNCVALSALGDELLTI